MSRTLGLVLLIALCLAPRSSSADDQAGVHGLRAGEAARLYGGTLPRIEPGVACFLVRDIRSGTPLEGVVLTQHFEMQMGRNGWGPEEARSETDRQGLVWIHCSAEEADYDSHWVFRRPGFGSTSEYGTPGGATEAIELGPGRSVHGRIVDVRGQPVVGALIEHKYGCAHAPPIHRAHTDAEGRFVLSDVRDEGDLLLARGPGVAFDYLVMQHVGIELTPPVEVAMPGITLDLRIAATHLELGEDAVVNGSGTSRSSFAPVDAQGRCVISSLLDGSALELYDFEWLQAEGTPTEEYVPAPQLDTSECRRDGPVLWTPRSPWHEDLMETEVPVRLSLPPVEAEPGDYLRLELVRLSDGYREICDVALANPHEHDRLLHLAPGSWRIRPGTVFQRWLPDEAHLIVPLGSEPLELHLSGREQVPLRLEDESELSRERGISVFHGTDEAGAYPESEGTLWGPRDTPLSVLAVSDEATVFGTVGPLEDGVREIRVPAPRSYTVRFRSADGAELIGASDYWHDGRERTGQAVIERHFSVAGRHAIELYRKEFFKAEVVFDIPEDSEAPIEVVVPTELFSEAPGQEIRIIPAQHENGVSDWASCAMQPPGRDGVFRTNFGFDSDELDAHRHHVFSSAHASPGAWLEFDVETPDEAEDEQVHWMRWREELREPPYVFHEPTATLELTIDCPAAQEDPDTIDVAAALDGELVTLGIYNHDAGQAVPVPPLTVRRLRAGRHTLIVAATGHESVLVEFEIAAGEARRLRVPLRAKR